MGKLLLINLLVHTWRSQGLRIIITAASAKVARLIGGHTVHSMFLARPARALLHGTDYGKRHSEHFLWLLTTDIIIINEFSMVTAGAVAGIDEALTFVMSNSITCVASHPASALAASPSLPSETSTSSRPSRASAKMTRCTRRVCGAPSVSSS